MKKRSNHRTAAYYTMFVAIVFTTLVYGAVHQPVIGISYLLILSLLLLWAMNSISNGKIVVAREPLQLILFAASAYGLVQVVPYGSIPGTGGIDSIPLSISLDRFATLNSSVHLLILGIYFSAVLVLFDSVKRLFRFASFITIFGAAFAFFGVLQSLLSPDAIYGLLYRPYAQPFASFVSRNNFAVWMELAIAIPLGLLFSGSIPKDKRLILVVAIVMMGISLVTSGSRGGLVTLFLQVVFVVLVSYDVKGETGSVWVKSLLAAILLISIVAGTAFVGGESSLTRLSTEQLVNQHDVTRPEIWRVATQIIGDNPIFGVGLGAFGVAYTRYDVASGFERVEQAHNDYLQVLTDAGIVGAVLGLLFLAGLFRSGYKALRTTDRTRRGIGIGAMTGVFGVLVHSLFDFGLHTTSIALLFLTLVALLIASSSKYEDDDIEQSTDRQRKHRPVRA